MADAIDPALGFGSVAGSSASPVDILSSIKRNFITLENTDTINWLFAKDVTDPGPYKIALPGKSLTIAVGPQNAANITKIKGFGATPSNGGTATILAVISADKIT